MSKPNEKPRVVPGNWYAELNGCERIINVSEPHSDGSQAWFWLAARGTLGSKQTNARLKLIAPVPSSTEAAGMRDVCEKADLVQCQITEKMEGLEELRTALEKLNVLDALKGGTP